MGAIQTWPSGTANQHLIHSIYYHRPLLFLLAPQSGGDGENDELVHCGLRWRHAI